MKMLALPVIALAVAAFALPAAAAGCQWSQPKVEKPKEEVTNPSA